MIIYLGRIGRTGKTTLNNHNNHKGKYDLKFRCNFEEGIDILVLNTN